jgi:hypothetical protein
VCIIYGCDSHSKTQKHISNGKKIFYTIDTLPNGTIRYRPNYLRTPIDSENIQLSFFDTIPETIGKSGEFYCYDTTTLHLNRYIFLTNLTDFAIIRIRGKDIYLMKENDKSVTIDNAFHDVFSGNGYSIYFIHKVISHKSGITYERGFIEIKNIKYEKSIMIHGGYKL